VLAGQPDELREFLLRTAVLERLSASLCDHLTGRADSAETLERLERRNLFLVPLDSTRSWYRYHRLFRELLRHELRLTEPELIPELHRRALEWHRDRGAVAEAINHATAADEFDAARELIDAHWSDFFNQGRLETVGRWLAGLPREHLLSHPATCVAGAWLALDRGRLDEARDWLEAAEDALTGDEDASSRAAVGVLRAVYGFKSGDLAEAGRAADRVLAIETSEDPFPHTVAGLIRGVTLYWKGQLAEARAALSEAEALAADDRNDLGRAYSLGYLGMIAVDEFELEEAERLGRSATGLSEDPGFTEHFVLMAGHLAMARAAEARADLPEAERLNERAAQLADRGAGRIEIAATLIALARLRQLRGHRDAGRDLLRRARMELDACPDPGPLAAELAAAERTLSPARGATPAPGEELTDRELAVLRMLASTLSRREIADALFVSANTVKTHMRSIYRKLEVSDRKEALARARERSLL
jgi:ATP/maltotriose-dependent transcriptional regulator MalT